MHTLGTVLVYSEDYDGPQAILAEALRVIEEAREAEPVVSQPEPAPATEPDLSTVEGLRAVLVGRTANLTLQGGEAPYTVVGVERWTSPDGALVRDYVKLKTQVSSPTSAKVRPTSTSCARALAAAPSLRPSPATPTGVTASSATAATSAATPTTS